MLDRLAEVPWTQLGHAYGRADDVPALLTDLVRGDAEQVDTALEALWQSICHQGSVYSASVPAIGFLIEIAATGHPKRIELVGLAGEMGSGLNRGLACGDDDPDAARYGARNTRNSVIAARDALTDHTDTLLSWLTDPDGEFRSTAITALSACTTRAIDIIPALATQLAAETAPANRVCVLRAVTELAIADGDPDYVGDAHAWLTQLQNNPDASLPDRAAACTLLLVKHHDQPTADMVDIFAAAVGDPHVREAIGPLEGVDTNYADNTMASWFCDILGDAQPERHAFAERLSHHPDPRVRADACEALYEIADLWRTPTASVVTRLADMLADSHLDVRARAAEALAAIGEHAASAADALAAALAAALDTALDTVVEAELDDELAGTATESKVARWALYALAFLGDARAVPAAIAHLEDPGGEWPAGRFTRRICTALAPYAEDLLPAISTRVMADPITVHDIFCPVQYLLGGISQWSSIADRVVPVLRHAAYGWHSQQAVHALADLAAGGRTTLQSLVDDPRCAYRDLAGELLAQQDPQTGGIGHEPSDKPIGDEQNEERIDQVLQQIRGGKLRLDEHLTTVRSAGPRATDFLPAIRDLTRDDRPWTRIDAAVAIAAVERTSHGIAILLNEMPRPGQRIFTYHIAALESLAHLVATLPSVPTTTAVDASTANASAHVGITNELDQVVETIQNVLADDRRIGGGAGRAGFHNKDVIHDDEDDRKRLRTALEAIRKTRLGEDSINGPHSREIAVGDEAPDGQ